MNTRPPDYQTTRPPDHQPNRPPDHQTTRPAGHCVIIRDLVVQTTAFPAVATIDMAVAVFGWRKSFEIVDG